MLCIDVDHRFTLNMDDPSAKYNWVVTGPATLLSGQGTNEIYLRPYGDGIVNVECRMGCPGIGIHAMANPSWSGYTVTSPATSGLTIAGPDTMVAGVADTFNFGWYVIPPPLLHTGLWVGANNHNMGVNPPPPGNGQVYNTVSLTFPATSDSGNVYALWERWLGCGTLHHKPVYILGALHGPATGCVGTTATYTLPAGTASNWSVTGGFILSGQGTNTVTIQWNTAGPQSLQCTWSYGIHTNQTSTRNIIVDVPTAPTILGPTTLCTQQETYGVTTQPGHRYSFSVTGANVVQTNSNSVTIAITSSPNITVTVRDSIGTCGSSSTLNITHTVPYTTMTGPSHVCQNAPHAYSVTPVAGATYTWSTNSGSIISGQGSPSATLSLATPAFNAPVRCTLSLGGCTMIVTLPVTTYLTPPVNLGPDQSICFPGSLTLQNIGYFGGSFFNHPTAHSNSAGGTNPTFTVSSPGTHWMHRIEYYPGATCENRDTVVITNSLPLSTSLGPDVNACTSPHTLTPTVTGATAPFTYLWSTGATTASINVTTSGSYWVQVSKPGFCSDRDTVNVTMTPMSPVTISTFPMPICIGQSTTLTAFGSYVSYLWSTGATTPSIVVTPPGTYGLTVTDANGCVGSASITITPNANPTPTITGQSLICGTGPITLGTGGFSSYLWSTGATTASISVTAPGTYSVTVTDANGCTGIATHTVTAGTIPAPTITGPSVICGAGPITLSTGSFSAYLWSNGATTQSISVSTPGTYNVTVTNTNGCTGSATRNITQSNAPATILGTNQTVCPGPFSISSAPFSAYLWSTGATTQAITVNNPGTYSITVTDASGCTWTDNQVITHHTAPAVILGPDTSMCPDTSFVITSAPFASYLWSVGATTQSITGPMAGTYIITVTDANACTWTDAFVLSLDPACVWPGDANHDGVADNSDIVAMAFTSGSTGAIRPGGNTSWYGQPGPPWAQNLPGGANYKHSDADASGTVLPADTLVVIQNYGLTHNKTGGATGAIPIFFVGSQPSYTAGDVVQVQVHLGDASNIPNFVVGIAYSVLVNGITTQPGQVWWSFPSSFFGNPSSTQLCTGFEDVVPGRHDAGQGRMGGLLVGGFGHIATLNIRTDAINCPQPNNNISLSFANPMLYRSDFSLEPLGPLAATISVAGAGVGGIVVPAPRLSLYPVPAGDQINVAYGGFGENLELQVTDLSGRVLLTHACSSADGIVNLPTAGMADGLYLLTARASEGRTITKRFTVLHR